MLINCFSLVTLSFIIQALEGTEKNRRKITFSSPMQHAGLYPPDVSCFPHKVMTIKNVFRHCQMLLGREE